MTNKNSGRLVILFLALAAFPPAMPAQRVLDGQRIPQRIPGQRLLQPRVSANAILPVTIEIVRACTVSASDLIFGAYNSNSQAAVQGQTAISLNCGVGVTAEIALDAGTGPGRNTKRRQMRQDLGIDRLDYDLYQDPGRQIHWGNKSRRDTLEVLTTSVPHQVPIYGEIPSGQRVRNGAYSDTITVTVHF